MGTGLFNIFVNGLANGIKCILSKLAGDTKLSSAVDTLEGRETIQRDQNRLEKSAPENLMRLHLGWDNSRYL